MTYDEKVKTMLEYLKLKIEERDWHGVADCAMDLREYEAEQRTKPKRTVTVVGPTGPGSYLTVTSAGGEEA